MICIIDCGSNKTPLIQKCVNELGYDTLITSVNTIDSASLSSCAKLIISGAPILLTEIEPAVYLGKFKFLLHFNKPVLGICFGHQLLGMEHGSSVSRCEEVRTDIEIKLEDSVLFKGLSTTSIFNEDHCEMISLPNNFIRIATSTNCAIEAMQHLQKPLFGVQFHPETSGENGKKLFQNFLNIND